VGAGIPVIAGRTGGGQERAGTVTLARVVGTDVAVVAGIGLADAGTDGTHIGMGTAVAIIASQPGGRQKEASPVDAKVIRARVLVIAQSNDRVQRRTVATIVYGIAIGIGITEVELAIIVHVHRAVATRLGHRQ